MKTSFTAVSLFVSFLATAFFSHAASAIGFYGGVSLGQASAEYGGPDVGGITTENIGVDNDDNGYKLFLGYRFIIFSAELSYIDFGEVSNSLDEIVDGVTETRNSSVSVSGVSAFAIANFGVGPADLFIKTGGFMWDSQFETAVKAANEERSADEDGFDLAYGLGASFGLFSLTARVEYEYFNVGDFEDLSMTSIGLAYSF